MENVLRCPGCSAAVRPDAQWCSLCYRDLRPAPAPAPAASYIPGQRASTAVVASVLSAASATGAAAGGWPCLTCSATVPLDLDACPACGSPFLARLAGDAGRHRSADRKVGTDALRAMPRTARLVAGLVLGILLAVFLPIALALLG